MLLFTGQFAARRLRRGRPRLHRGQDRPLARRPRVRRRPRVGAGRARARRSAQRARTFAAFVCGAPPCPRSRSGPPSSSRVASAAGFGLWASTHVSASVLLLVPAPHHDRRRHRDVDDPCLRRKDHHMSAFWLTLALITPLVAAASASTTEPAGGDAVSAGDFSRVYDPSAGDEPWYINDHTFFRDHTGTWHLIGITHAEPADPSTRSTSPTPPRRRCTGRGPSSPSRFRRTRRRRNAPLGAARRSNTTARYWMFYCAAATSTHGVPDPPRDVRRLRDVDPPGRPAVRRRIRGPRPDRPRVGDQWVMYYTANSDAGRRQPHVMLPHERRTWCTGATGRSSSPTLRSAPGAAAPSPVRRQSGRRVVPVHRPTSAPEYSGPTCIRSGDPFDFEGAELVGHIASHAAEVVVDGDDWFVTAAGWVRAASTSRRWSGGRPTEGRQTYRSPGDDWRVLAAFLHGAGRDRRLAGEPVGQPHR